MSYASEFTPRTQAILAGSARQARPLNHGRPESQEQENRQKAMRENRVLLRGRYEGAREVWDVVKLMGDKYELYAAGLMFMEEAAELASQCLRGRICVSLAGTRTLLAAGQNMVSPVRDVNPLAPAVTLQPRDGHALGRSRLIEVIPKKSGG